MGIFDFYKRHYFKNACKALCREAELVTDCIERNTMQARILKLEKELEDTNSAMQELLELEKMCDTKVFMKYQYKRWDEVPIAIRNYIAKRYGFHISHNPGLGRYCGKEQLVITSVNPYMGQAFDTYKSIKEEE